jgi:hypothetical protein
MGTTGARRELERIKTNRITAKSCDDCDQESNEDTPTWSNLKEKPCDNA